MWLRGVTMPLRGPVYETILCRGPCLDTHPPTCHHHHNRPPTDTHHHPPTHTQTHHFINPISCQARCWEILLPGLPSSHLSPWPKPDISAFTAPPTLLLLHLTLSPLPEPVRVFSLSFITVGKHLLWVWHLPANTNTPSTNEPTGHP